MKEAVIHLHASGKLVALVGNPNCGKTALFNLLTDSRQKVANYAGVTVERKEGALHTPSGKKLRLLDLPGTYSLHPRSLDERVTHDVLYGNAVGEKRPDMIVCVVDATNLRRGLRLVLAVKRLGIPCVVALNMTDLAEQRLLLIDEKALSQELGLPVVRTVGIKGGGEQALKHLLDDASVWQYSSSIPSDATVTGTEAGADASALTEVTVENIDHSTELDHDAVRRILEKLHLNDMVPHLVSDKIDRLVLHPFWGSLILAVVLFLVFQAVFAWAEAPMELIQQATEWVGQTVQAALPDNWVRSLLVNGIIAGAGGVIVFLPQIIILFFFILVLEESGYLPRAAFLLDRLMGSVGLSGRSFIPLLSSFACAIPGIMAARSISNQRDRLVTIMIAPMMTCSARLPVYALLIGALIPQREVAGIFELQGLVLFSLYLAGIVGALIVAWILKRFTSKGQIRSLMMELPNYHLPTIRNVALGLWQRVEIFMRRVGGVIMVMTIALWVLSSYPGAPIGATGAPIEYSIAGYIGRGLEFILSPIGFNWQISLALVPGMAAREVVVSSLGTVYALSASVGDTASALTPIIAQQWSLATGLSLLAWFVFAPQCLSTIATVKRETGGWKMPIIMLTYLFALAYAASFITYRVALSMGAG